MVPGKAWQRWAIPICLLFAFVIAAGAFHSESLYIAWIVIALSLAAFWAAVVRNNPS